MGAERPGRRPWRLSGEGWAGRWRWRQRTLCPSGTPRSTVLNVLLWDMRGGEKMRKGWEGWTAVQV